MGIEERIVAITGAGSGIGRETTTASAISPEAIARGILFAIEQPDDVDVGRIAIRPTAQD